MDISNEIYIGDGVYANFDKYGVRLRTERDNGNHVVYLESEVYEALVEEWKRVHEPA